MILEILGKSILKEEPIMAQETNDDITNYFLHVKWIYLSKSCLFKYFIKSERLGTNGSLENESKFKTIPSPYYIYPSS